MDLGDNNGLGYKSIRIVYPDFIKTSVTSIINLKKRLLNALLKSF